MTRFAALALALALPMAPLLHGWQNESGQLPVEEPPAVTPAPETAEVYAYDAEGRRDPFVSLLNRGTDLRPVSERPPGLSGLGINEVSLRGLVQFEDRYLAVLQAPDNRTYILHGDEQLFDGVVKSISAEGVAFLQEVNDPLSLDAEREVLKTLQGQEEGL